MGTSLKRLALAMALGFGFVAAGCATHDTTIGTKIDDTAITTQIKAALFKDPGVSGQQVSVETVDGVVQLSGFVNSASAKARAVSIARSVSGVRSIKDDISVR
ncbi:MAG: BON domain-containing protein [Burkholderiaceae bacterium]